MLTVQDQVPRTSQIILISMFLISYQQTQNLLISGLIFTVQLILATLLLLMLELILMLQQE